MRIRRLCISAELFLSLFHAGQRPAYAVVENAVPGDARLVNVRHGWPNSIELLIESESFDEVPQAEKIPDIQPICMRGTPVCGGKA